MKRIALLVALTATIIASVIVAHAATLKVDAGVLQTQTTTVHIVVPVDSTITVIGRRFNLNQNAQVGNDNRVNLDVQVGKSYTITWTGAAIVPCSSVEYTVPGDESEGIDGSFVADGDVTRSFCAGQSSGTITITVIDQ